MLMTSLLGLLTPLAAYTSIWAIFALQIGQVIIVIIVVVIVVVVVVVTDTTSVIPIEIILVISRVCLRGSPILR